MGTGTRLVMKHYNMENSVTLTVAQYYEIDLLKMTQFNLQTQEVQTVIWSEV